MEFVHPSVSGPNDQITVGSGVRAATGRSLAGAASASASATADTASNMSYSISLWTEPVLIPSTSHERALRDLWADSMDQCIFAHKRTHAHLAPTHMCRCAHAISVPPNPSALGLSGRAELTARVGNPGMPSARTHPPHCRQRAAVTTVCGQLCAMPPLLRCQLVNGHASSWPLSLCMACAAISHQASLSSISA